VFTIVNFRPIRLAECLKCFPAVPCGLNPDDRSSSDQVQILTLNESRLNVAWFELCSISINLLCFLEDSERSTWKRLWPFKRDGLSARKSSYEKHPNSERLQELHGYLVVCRALSGTPYGGMQFI